jgi:hypothetical protein
MTLSILFGALLAGSSLFNAARAQVGVGTTTPDASAALHVSAANKGVLFPQVSLGSLTDGAAVPGPAPSLLVYNTNAGLAGGVGFYYNAGTAAAPQWMRLNTGTAPAGAGWSLTGNAATNPATNYLGTTDAQPLVLRTEGQELARQNEDLRTENDQLRQQLQAVQHDLAALESRLDAPANYPSRAATATVPQLH